jgi:hypothetical protein
MKLINIKMLSNPYMVLPGNFQKAVVDQVAEFKRLFHNDSTDKRYSPVFMLGKIDNDSNYNTWKVCKLSPLHLKRFAVKP